MRDNPYSFVAAHLLQGKSADIAAFWTHFADNADELDAAFETGDMAVVVAVMAKLTEHAPELMWEFGPAPSGHSLCITAEWNNDLRPLARCYVDLAPDLAQWRFTDFRDPGAPDAFAQNYEARFQSAFAVDSIDLTLGPDNRIDMRVHGAADQETLGNDALKAATLLLGEAHDRDWLGEVTAETTHGKGLLGRFMGGDTPPFDPQAFLTSFDAMIAKADQATHPVPLAQLPLDDRAVSLVNVTPREDQSLRADLITFAVMQPSYAHAVLAPALFASRNHSKHDEWFMCLRVPHHGQGDVSQRSAIEDLLHDTLSEAGIGGLMAAGHGTETYHIDIGLTAVTRGLALIAERFADAPWAQDTTIHFLDAGLGGYPMRLRDLPRHSQ